MTRLTLVASLNSVSSYGLHAMQIVRGLKARGIQVDIRAISREEPFGVPLPDDIKERVVKTLPDSPWELVLHPHGFMPTPGKRTIYYTALESTRLPKESVVHFNRCEAVLTPSLWGETVLSANGVNRPIRVVPKPVRYDPLRIGPEALRYRPPPLTWDQSIDRLVVGLQEFGVFGDNNMLIPTNDPRFIARQGMIQPNIDKGIVSLRRNGDIVILLPLMKKLAEERKALVRMIVHKDYLPLLEGVSYVEPIGWDGDMEDPVAAAKSTGAVNAQVFHRGMMPTTLPGNFAKLAWHKLGHAWERYAPLVFDRRSPAREQTLSAQTFVTTKPKVLVKLHGFSSPLDKAEDWLLRIKKAFGANAEVVNLDEVKAPRIYDMIGLMDRAACLLTVDTATLWLAHASRCPNIALVHPHNYRASPPRGNCLLRVRYTDLEAQWAEVERLVNASVAFEAAFNDGLVHVFSDHKPQPKDKDRYDRAGNTWSLLEAREMAFKSERTAKLIGDSRDMPYVRDMIEKAFSIGNEGIVVIHNNDILFDSDLRDDIIASCAQYGCWWAYRTEKPGAPSDGGADVFAFTRKWWNLHQHQFPDFLLGYSWWDNVMRRLMLWSGCPEGLRLYYHEKHPGVETRKQSPGERYNVTLAKDWLEKWDEAP